MAFSSVGTLAIHANAVYFLCCGCSAISITLSSASESSITCSETLHLSVERNVIDSLQCARWDVENLCSILQNVCTPTRTVPVGSLLRRGIRMGDLNSNASFCQLFKVKICSNFWIFDQHFSVFKTKTMSNFGLKLKICQYFDSLSTFFSI